MSKTKYVVALFASAALSCSSHHQTGVGGGGDDDSGGNMDGGNTDGGTSDGFGSCAATYVQATLKPLDIFMMLDYSGSMKDKLSGSSETKWEAVSAAIESFLAQPDLNGIAVGLQYFGTGNPSSCNASSYSTPAVGIAALPGNSSALDTSITGRTNPNTDTPTYPALQGALEYATTWQGSNTGDKVVVVLATDGDPSSNCDDSIADISALAGSSYAATPSIPTYVIGVGSSLGNLDDIAAGGGTGSAFIVSTSADAGSAFLAALNAIRGASLGCTYSIPQPTNGQMLDFNEVNVIYTPGGSTTQEVIPQVTGASACPATGDAWYYDNPSAPTEIILCTNTCNTIQADTSGSVNIGLGCQTIIP